jgi:hypothetical protein
MGERRRRGRKEENREREPEREMQAVNAVAFEIK